MDSISTSVLVPGIKLEGEIDLTWLEKNDFKVSLIREMSFYKSSYLSVTINMDVLNPEI